MAGATFGGLSHILGNHDVIAGSAGKIVRDAAASVGGEDSPQALEAGFRGLKDFADKANTRKLFRFARRSQADQALSADQTTIVLPDDFFAMSSVQLTDATTGEVYKTLREQNYQEFQITEGQQNSGAETWLWYSRSLYFDKSIEVYPAITTSMASSYKSRLNYYIEVARLETDQSELVAPRQIERAMRLHCIAWIVDELDSRNVARVRDKWGQADQALKDFFDMDQREDAAIRNMRVRYSRLPRTNRRTV
jgi:hypothetical protein